MIILSYIALHNNHIHILPFVYYITIQYQPNYDI